jgi:chemotaxis protein histidine kinase CheA
VFSGATILGDGQVALMLDVAALVAQAEARPGAVAKDSSYQRKET